MPISVKLLSKGSQKCGIQAPISVKLLSKGSQKCGRQVPIFVKCVLHFQLDDQYVSCTAYIIFPEKMQACLTCLVPKLLFVSPLFAHFCPDDFAQTSHTCSSDRVNIYEFSSFYDSNLTCRDMPPPKKCHASVRKSHSFLSLALRCLITCAEKTLVYNSRIGRGFCWSRALAIYLFSTF